MSTRAPFTRTRLNGERIFETVSEVLTWLLIGYRPRYDVPRGNLTSLQVLAQGRTDLISWDPITPDDVKSLTVVLNTHLKLLSKVLPDLKAVELNDVTEARRYTTQELAQRLASLRGVNDYLGQARQRLDS
jgi:hypothetical protein